MSPGSACQRCRQRHIKCDATRPSCKQCVSGKHECPGYPEDWKFINNGAKPPRKRQKRQSIREAKAHDAKTSTGKITETNEDAFIEIRRTNTVSTSQRSEHLDIPPLDFPKASDDALQSLDSSIPLQVELGFDLGDNHVNEASVVGLQPGHFGAPLPAPEESPGLISSGSTGEFEMGLAALASEFMLESEQEIVFLLRHYTDNLAPWLDIFGDKCFFQTCIPRLVGAHPVLKYSIAALAAKHLSNLGGFRATNCGPMSALALTELYPSAGNVDWAFKAASYYHQAATHSQHPSPLYTTEASSILTDVAMASNAILTVYEMIDSNYDEFYTRIREIKSQLVRYPNDGLISQPVFTPFKFHGSSAALASYWHCLPHDLLSSYDQKRISILDCEIPYDGLGGSDDGLNLNEPSSMTKTPWAQLFILITQIIDKFATNPGRRDHGTKDVDRNNSWDYLWNALDRWHAQLDIQFEPYSHYKLSSHLTLSQGLVEPVFDEILFPSPASAATLSYYHFARILLLLAKPTDQSNPQAMLLYYREILTDIEDHCTKICGIAAGRPGPAARIHSVQPLFLAGQCLVEPRLRTAVVQLLRDVEADTGWPTASHISRLHQGWNRNTRAS
ncbi:Zn(2)-C6 fungal-type domain-containing protein [Trichoderma simmonsii]|uniref:Zn(2)-C6 fungal-type domain-containing protein n=1 Tax=Trichoderma simmonsii TaxID=1491479 RepID=A0A8G0PK74_9HYPO|nr:Zn(2)-C6 fungal-type domain-containing protein [Trichoderma simmonsii]